MGQLCDSGCRVTFDAISFTVKYNSQMILTGTRTPACGISVWSHVRRLRYLSLVPPAAAACMAAGTSNFLLPPAAMPMAPLPPCASCIATTVNSATPGELVAFAHAALFPPSLSTLHGALARNFLPSNFLGLTTRYLTKHPPPSVAMIKGHLDQTRKNQCSTKASPAASPHPPPVPAVTKDPD